MPAPTTDLVLRGDVEATSWSVFYLRDGHVIRPRSPSTDPEDVMVARELIVCPRRASTRPGSPTTNEDLMETTGADCDAPS